MQLRRQGFSICAMMLTVVAAAIGLALIVRYVRWLQYPHIKVSIFNETPTPIGDLDLRFMYGERTAAQLRPGGAAVTEIQSGGDAGIYFSYQDAGGILQTATALYEESGNRGFLEIHVTGEGVRMRNGIHAGEEIPILGIRRVAPAGEMTLK
jgi:hypothetical protein